MCSHYFVMHYFYPGFNKHSGLWLFIILQLRCDTLILQVWPSYIMQKGMSEQNIYPFYNLKLILEPPPTQ